MSAMVQRFLVVLVVLAFVVGCGEVSDRPATVSVSGTVTYNDAPVEGARVAFSPKGEGHAASGTTDASGNFTLTTFESGDGAVVGSYDVIVSKTEGGEQPDVGAPAGGGETDEIDYEAVMDAMTEAGHDPLADDAGAAGGEVKDLLPAKYKDPAGSGLSAEVTADGENNFPFALTD